MEFTKHLSLAIQHEYFDSGPVPGISISPTEQCKKQLKKFGLLVKTDTGGLGIFKANSPDTGVYATMPSSEVAFDFLFFIADNQFYHYTALSAKKNDEIYLFSNQNANKKNTTTLVSSVVSATELGDITDGPLLGIIRLRLNFRLPAKLRLMFPAPSLKWNYYVITGPLRASLVVDGKLSGILFSKKENTESQSDAIVKALTNNYPKAKVASFKSDKVIALSNQGRKNIQLKNELTNSVIIKHLPNPSLHDNGIQIINLLD
ncbi:hypothetical protein [Pedobacter alluvionis]|uniref:Uncharacterized protein n=1 Tax=Pedobacter alluvionis TaxID=475253 RepID=A0A497Y9C0_9SPHI|nr:hypothetical protein [Pedobacter alluvionis]RLJ79431.1 hypothetical protein BCL90_0124 [Pedobacter alluvionis]TFB30778.1 hypothetical protein E3V97_09065 [Pedobacter alluvionis]